MKNETFMDEAVKLSRQKMMANEGGPFGAVVVKNGEIIGRGWNKVTSTNDPTAHAEISAIRDACEKLGDYSLKGCEIYSSCEPCPMCLTAIYWARMDKLYFAADRKDAAKAGFDDAFFYEQVCMPPKERTLSMEQINRDKALEVFQEWETKEDKFDY
jgi:guanine deaminase